MPTRLFLALSLVVASSLGTSAACANEIEGDSAPRERLIAPAPVWSVVGFTEFRAGMPGSGYNVAHGIDVVRAFSPRVRLGAGLTFPWTSDTYEYCGREGEPACVQNYYALQLIAELHALPRYYIDPWIRIGGGPTVFVNYYNARDFDTYHPKGGVMGSAAAGVDFHKSGFVGGIYGTFAVFSGNIANLGGVGVRLGGEF